MTDLRAWLPRTVDAVDAWMAQYGDFTQDVSAQVSDAALEAAFAALTARLTDNYPFGHPATSVRC